MKRQCRRALLLLLWLWFAAPGLAQSVTYYEFDPPVIHVDRTQPVLMQTSVSGNPTRVVFEYNPNNQPAGTDFEMRDDGTNGDRVAGDRIYSLFLPATQITAGLQPDDVFRRFLGFIKLSQGTTLVRGANILLGVYTNEIPRAGVAVLAPDVQRASHIVNIFDPQFFVPANFDLQRAARRFYQLFRDDYDIINIAVSLNYIQNRYHGAIYNDVQGIGKPLSSSSNSAAYGSDGRLIGFTVFPNANIFDGAESGYQHELGHQWINFLKVEPLSGGAPHWPLSSLASGIMGWSDPTNSQGLNYPCRLEPEAGGVRLVRRVGEAVFTDLDLYLMGLLPPEQVSDHYVFNDQVQARTLPCNNQLITSGITRVRMADIISASGPRVPNSVAAPKRFKLATVIVSKDGLLSEEAMSFFNFFSRRAEETREVPFRSGFVKATAKPFAISTGGRGSLETQIGATRNNAVISLSAASFGGATLAAESIVAGFGINLAPATAIATTNPLPTQLAGTRVTVRVGAVERLARLFFVSPNQVNFEIPSGTPPGVASIGISNTNGSGLAGTAIITAVAPGLFSANADGQGVPAAVVVRVRADGSQSFEPVAQFDAAQNKFVATPIDLGPTGEQVFLVLFGTGFRSRSALSAVVAKVGGVETQTFFAGAQGELVGLDQLNLQLPRALAGRGEVSIVLLVDGKAANVLQIRIK